jgi:type I restriction enzyme M protein
MEQTKKATIRLFQKFLSISGNAEGWAIKRLWEISQIFNGPCFGRSFADPWITEGPNVARYFTAYAVTLSSDEAVKYLDLEKATAKQLRKMKKLHLREGMILVAVSGAVGRVALATARHEGAVGTNNLIRVVISDEILRGYILNFLSSDFGQVQLRQKADGTTVETLEVQRVRNVLVPVPIDRSVLESLHGWAPS